MAISARQVNNKRDNEGKLTGKPGTVYDVNIKYNTPEGQKSYMKRGFLTKKEASQHEAEMKIKFRDQALASVISNNGEKKLSDYMNEWLQNYGASNLRPSTYSSYQAQIRNHIIPNIGTLKLKQITPEVLDKMFQLLYSKGLSNSSVRYTQRILSVSLEHARKYHYIETNPARDILTKFGKQGKTPEPYTVSELQALMSKVIGTEWEMPIMLAGMYGLRLGEVIGLRWQNVDLENMTFSVCEQLPFQTSRKATVVEEMAPTKSNDRTLPITETTKPYFDRQLEIYNRKKELATKSGFDFYDNGFVVSKPDGSPYHRDAVSANFGQLLRHLEMRHIRFHDLRHTAATNMHELTGDFFTVGEILGHTLKGVGISLGISNNLDAVTATYINVRQERKEFVLEKYHKSIHETAVDKPKIRKEDELELG